MKKSMEEVGESSKVYQPEKNTSSGLGRKEKLHGESNWRKFYSSTTPKKKKRKK